MKFQDLKYTSSRSEFDEKRKVFEQNFGSNIKVASLNRIIILPKVKYASFKSIGQFYHYENPLMLGAIKM